MRLTGQDPAGHDNDNGLREDDLQAYVDRQLEVRRLATLEAYLAAHPREAARVAAYRLQIAGLHALFGPRPGTSSARAALPPAIAVLACELDAHLRRPAESATPPSRRARGPSRRLAAAVALLLAAGTAAGLALTQSAGRDDAQVAAARQILHAPLQTTAARRQNAVGLAVQPGHALLRAPNLEALGFRLIAERVIDRNAGPPATQLLYQDAEGQRVTLAMRVGGKAGRTSFTFKRNGEAAQFVWQDEHMAYSLIGRMDEARLLSIAEAVSRSLRGGQQDAAPPTATLESAVQPQGGEAPAPRRDGTVPALAIDPRVKNEQPPPELRPEPSDHSKDT